MSKKIVLHMGFDKVGSSSLQKYLSNNDLISNKGKFKYLAINGKGRLITAERIRKISSQNLTGYISSFPHIATKCNPEIIKNDLDNYLSEGETPILSCEGWARLSKGFSNNDFLKKIDRQATVVFYVRPQVSWLNSAWWQWYNWDKRFLNPTEFFHKGTYGHMDWNSIIGEWEGVENVDKIIVRVQTTDVVEDFLSIFNIQSTLEQRVKSKNNVSSSPIVLKLLTQFPELRGVHDARVDWKLSRIVSTKSSKTPWVIDSALIKEIINTYDMSNRKLLERLDESHQKLMLEELKWWSSEAFNNLNYTKPSDLILSDNEKDLLLKQFAEYILKA